ncbi:hypothetical protein AB9P05_19490 [Roseivirga sp. BDSF3-8]|uniref:hypothetical protein n=1 Tax=Roseivirga sp. BDSF3-8 TaxID=3241598 RepID=UPI003531F93D
MKRGFDFISKDEIVYDYLIQVEQSLHLNFPKRFKYFVSKYPFSSNNIELQMKKDELRGFEFPIEAILFEPTTKTSNPLYFDSFRDLSDIADELKTITEDELWQKMGWITIGYSTVGEKICLGVKGEHLDEIWRVNDDSIAEKKYEFLASDIFEFVEGLISKRVTT